MYIRPARVEELIEWLGQFDFLSPTEKSVIAQKLWDWSDVIITSSTAS